MLPSFLLNWKNFIDALQKLKRMDMIAFCWHEDLTDKVELRHTESINFWIETSQEIAEILSNSEKIAKAVKVNITVDQNRILDHLEKHV